MEKIDICSHREVEFNDMFTFRINWKVLKEKYIGSCREMDIFILGSEVGTTVDAIIDEVRDEYSLDYFHTRSLIWATLNLYYIRGVITWNEKDPFKDLYEYEKENIKFKVELPRDVRRNENLYKNNKKELFFNAMAKDIKHYKKYGEGIVSNTTEEIIKILLIKNNLEIGKIVFLQKKKSNTFIIGAIGLYEEKFDLKILEKLLIWSSSKLSIICNSICRSLEIRIREKDMMRKEVKALMEIGFKIVEEDTDKLPLLSMEI